MRSSLLSLFVLVITLAVAVACGGEKPSQPAPAPATPAAAAPPSKPEPPKRAPRPAADILHGAPAPTEARLGELYDIGRDLMAVAKAEAGAVENLADDLPRLRTEGTSSAEVQALAADLGRSLQGKTLDEAAINRIAALLYAVMNSEALTAAQRTALATDLRSTLTAAGAAAPAASAAAARVDAIASAVTATRR